MGLPVPRDPEPHGGTWTDDYEDCVWPEPRWWGIWCSWDANGDTGPNWCLGGITPPSSSWDYGVRVAQFRCDRWSGAKAVFEAMIAWAQEGLPPSVCDGICDCDEEEAQDE